ncbi:MAG: helix-turn-helix transcriptional regulator [Selenomonadaceae bacterium]|nr:helix-turn-helix transcriptional regulator [Selenomonadaceae bacterium]MBP3723132.1 helix-turn-helix transcriptional regulator [Selenomonadaceae bacterium]
MRRGQRGYIGGLDTRLKESRCRANLSRSQVAEQIGITPSTLADYEIGHRQPSLPVLVSLADIYGVATDYLLGRNNINLPYLPNTTGLTDEQIDAICYVIRAMKR